MDKTKEFFPCKKGELQAGDTVFLTNDNYIDYNSKSHPHYKTGYFCPGKVTYVDDDYVVVRWDNGHSMDYHYEDLTFIENNDSPTRSFVILNEPIRVGDQVLVKKGTRMVTQGDYCHDTECGIFVKIDDQNRFTKKKLFTKVKK